MTAYQSL